MAARLRDHCYRNQQTRSDNYVFFDGGTKSVGPAYGFDDDVRPMTTRDFLQASVDIIECRVDAPAGSGFLRNGEFLVVNINGDDTGTAQLRRLTPARRALPSTRETGAGLAHFADCFASPAEQLVVEGLGSIGIGREDVPCLNLVTV